ncbi:hypothetical protein Y1Q_0002179 [Alligator mississippiensis]|uniref:Uncharacterized protein n=1 Tax=Alligator mississippiensis TaxID=8496 RepID=A0A151MPU7_ALLMI|nr:hypothetical protein Y1Q_0002179 [Alligator mississippiensis]
MPGQPGYKLLQKGRMGAHIQIPCAAKIAAGRFLRRLTSLPGTEHTNGEVPSILLLALTRFTTIFLFFGFSLDPVCKKGSLNLLQKVLLLTFVGSCISL